MRVCSGFPAQGPDWIRGRSGLGPKVYSLGSNLQGLGFRVAEIPAAYTTKQRQSVAYAEIPDNQTALNTRAQAVGV